MTSRRFGDFELQWRIGYDGPFMLFWAKQTSLNRPVMLRILPARLATLERTALLRREAEAADKLDHPAIVRVYEVGEAAGSPFLALAPIEGERLTERLKKGAVSPALALDCLRQLAEAIEYAHDRGMIHGSVRPEVVWITRDGQIKLAGFGCSIQFEQLDDTDLVGNAAYLAPEQAGRRGAVGRATDVYALGALLYAMATGSPPHRAASVDETLRLIRGGRRVRPSRLRPDLPEVIDRICMKCLHVKPASRYSTDRPVSRLLADLRRALGHRDDSFLSEPFVRWLRRHYRLARAAMLLLLFAVLPALWDWQRRQSDWDVITNPNAYMEQYDRVARHFAQAAIDQPFDAETASGLMLARFRTGRLPSDNAKEKLAWQGVHDEWTAVEKMTRILAAVKQQHPDEARAALNDAQNAGYKPGSNIERRLLLECEEDLAAVAGSKQDSN